MKRPRLSEVVLKLARDSGKRPEELAVMSGASLSWVHLFLRGRVERPSCEFMQNLYEGLTQKPLLPGE